MEGNKISNANRKCVEWTILFEVGTLVRTMDTLRTADTKDRVFDKYVNKIRDIEDEHFETNSVRTKMLRIGSRLVSRICAVEICCVSGRVKQPTFDRSGTNFQESIGCLTCQVDSIRSSARPYIASLWVNDNPVRCMLVLLFFVIYVIHNLSFCL